MRRRTCGIPAALATAALLTATAGLAEERASVDRTTVDRTQIIGNRELPKVLYIVPWKKPIPGDLSGVPVESVLDEALAPVDRDVFRRQVHYDSLIHPAAVVQAPEASGAISPAPDRK